MSGNDATFVAQYPGLRYQETTLVLNRFHVSKSKLPGEVGENARRGIMAAFKQAYLRQHASQINAWLEFDQLELTETAESQARPTGCGCSCAGCDDQGYHCHKKEKDCYM